MRNIKILALLGIISMLAACEPADTSTGTGDLATSLTLNAKEACEADLTPQLHLADHPHLKGTLAGSNGAFSVKFEKPFADTYTGNVVRSSDGKAVFCNLTLGYTEAVEAFIDFVNGTCSIIKVTVTPATDGSIKPDTKSDGGPGHDTLKPDSGPKPDAGLTGGIHAICMHTNGSLLNSCQFSVGGANTCSTGSTSNDCWIGNLVPGVYQLVGSKTTFGTSSPVPVTVVADQDTDAVVKLSPLTDASVVTPDSGPSKPDSQPPVGTGSVKITVQDKGQLPLAGCVVEEVNIPSIDLKETTPSNGVVKFSNLPLNFALRFTATCAGKKIEEWNVTLTNTVEKVFTFVMSDVQSNGTLSWISTGATVYFGFPLTNLLSFLPAKLIKADGTAVMLNSPDGKLKCAITTGGTFASVTADCHTKLEGLGLVAGCAALTMTHPDATNSIVKIVTVKPQGSTFSCPAL